MDQVARWSAEDRRDLFRETAARRRFGNAVIVEKDFWVCWALKRVCALKGQPRIIFKGGTSLSKVFGLIRRFSEDIDLAFHRHDLGFSGPRDPSTPDLGKNERKRLVDELSRTAQRPISDTFLPTLRDAFSAALGEAAALQLDPSDGETVKFEYPRGLAQEEYTGGYVRPQVLLELGARSERDPQVAGRVQSYSAEVFSDQFGAPWVDVPTLAATRTFWEKVTLLHKRAMRAMPVRADRFSRHYHDVLVLAGTDIGREALLDTDLLRHVAVHSSIYFRTEKGIFESAIPGTLRLVPPEERLGALRTDYARMREMLFDDPMSFDELIAGLQALEARINS